MCQVPLHALLYLQYLWSSTLTILPVWQLEGQVRVTDAGEHPAKASNAWACKEPAQHIIFPRVTGPSNQTQLNFTSLTECSGTKQYPLEIQWSKKIIYHCALQKEGFFGKQQEAFYIKKSFLIGSLILTKDSISSSAWAHSFPLSQKKLGKHTENLQHHLLQ